LTQDEVLISWGLIMFCTLYEYLWKFIQIREVWLAVDFCVSGDTPGQEEKKSLEKQVSNRTVVDV